MSEYGFEYGETEELGEPQSNPQGPKWFREYMDKVSGQLGELKAENDRLKATQRQSEVAEALKAKGYAPTAATLYGGEPTKLDEWLTQHGSALAKLPAPEGQGGESEGQPPAGPPASSVPLDGQGQMQRMQEAGTQGVAPPQGSDKELAAAIAACQTPAQFAELMKAHGSPHDWS
jgi:hypothetical protein